MMAATTKTKTKTTPKPKLGTKRKRTALFDGSEWADMVAVRTLRLSDAILTRLTSLLATFGVTPLQYNVLRIIYVRDPEDEGIPVGAIGGVLLTSAPDVSRLIDRLEKGGLIERVRKADDRRVVRVRLTDAGFALVEKIHRPVVEHHEALLSSISKSDLERIAGDLARLYAQLPK